MGTVKVRWSVAELENVMSQFDTQRVYRSTSPAGPWTEATVISTRVPFVAGQTRYYFDDLTGDPTYWYVEAYYNTTTGNQSNYSTPIQVNTTTPAPVFTNATLEERANTIRAFLRDIPSKNILLDDIEFDDSEISRGMRLATSKYNGITPQTNVTTESLNEWLLVLGTCSILLRSEGARQLRNQVTAQDGNIAPIGIDEKQAFYAQWADRFDSEFNDMATKIKIQNNAESAYGTLSSGYRLISRYYQW